VGLGDYRRFERPEVRRPEEALRDEPRRREEEPRRGTLPPAFLASDSPMAIACLRLVTFLPERPLLSVPRFLSCMAFSTFADALLPYLAMMFPSGTGSSMP